MSQRPKSFPRELLLNVPGTFDDKVREMLAQKPVSNTNSIRSEAKFQESTAKAVSVIRKTIEKQPLAPFLHSNQNREPSMKANSSYKTINFDESNRASSFSQSPRANGYYQETSWNSGPSSYQGNYEKNPPNFQRYPNMGGYQQQPPTGTFTSQPAYPFQGSFSNLHPSDFNPFKAREFAIKIEESNYFTPEKGMRLTQELQETFSIDSTTSTIEPPLIRGNSSIKRQPYYNDDNYESNIAERERTSNLKSYLNSNVNSAIQSFIPNKKDGPETGRGVSQVESNESGKFTREKLYNHEQTKNSFKKAFKLKKATKFAQKNLNYWKEKTSFKHKPTSFEKIELELEDGKVDDHFNKIGNTVIEKSMINKGNENPILDNKPENANEEESIPFLYDNKSYFIDPLTFVFPL